MTRSRVRSLLVALAIAGALTPAVAQSFTLAALLQMPFEQLLRLQIAPASGARS
jgi:cytochrome P450